MIASEPGQATQATNQKTSAQSQFKFNWAMTERLGSMILGSALMLYGAKRRGIIPTVLGGVFLYRGAAGRRSFVGLPGWNDPAKRRQPQTSVPHRQGIKVATAVTIDRPASELYSYWRDLTNLPKFMKQLQSVQSADSGRSHWVLKSAAGVKLAWDAEIINEVPNELLAWRSLPGGDVDHAGSVRFEPAPGNRGTIVKVTFEYRPPVGTLGAVAANLLGVAPEQFIKTDLSRLKQLFEAGEISSVEGQPHGF
jgi:uncharacterized membrane protein